MCGIVGYIDFNKRNNEEILHKMVDIQIHRGPDDSGYSFSNHDSANIALGHRRLSILDLSNHGHQPMMFQHLEIVFNGEVYNFKEIRNELTKEGYHFESDSDTEVMLKAFHRWSHKAVDKFIGMFAFAIYDKHEQKLHLFRDRTGVKPLFYYFHNNSFLFASELKSFHQYPDFEKHIDPDSVAMFLEYGYVPTPYAIFKNTFKLKPGHYLTFDLKTKTYEEKEYWNVMDAYLKPKLKISETEATQEIENILQSSFSYRMVSDVPVGIFLSGGYDSSAIAALLQKESSTPIKTFAIGFENEKFNEAEYAREVSQVLGTEHYEMTFSEKDALGIIPHFSDMYDEPFGDVSALPTYFVSKLAKEYVTVALSGDGGDEIFGGYDKYFAGRTIIDRIQALNPLVKKPLSLASNILNQASINQLLSNILKKESFDTQIQMFSNMLSEQNSNNAYLHMIKRPHFSKPSLNALFDCELHQKETLFDEYYSLSTQLSSLECMMGIDYKTYMSDDILQKVDRASMAVSLEAREPFLDQRIIEFVAQLEDGQKVKNGEKKHLLKQIVHRYIPQEIMDRPKQGFGVPIDEWLKGKLKSMLLDSFEGSSYEGFNHAYIHSLLSKYLKGERVKPTKIWNLFIFQLWYNRWIKS